MLEIWLQYFPGKASLYSYGRFFLSCSKTLLSLGEFEWAQARNRTWSAYTSLNQKGLHNPFGPESQTGPGKLRRGTTLLWRSVNRMSRHCFTFDENTLEVITQIGSSASSFVPNAMPSPSASAAQNGARVFWRA